MNCQQYWKWNYFYKAPSITFFQILKSAQISFWLILKTSFGKDQSMKNNPPPDLFQNAQEGIKCIDACLRARTRTCTHTHVPLSYPLKPCSDEL